MARPLRLQFANALYHVIARGNALKDVFLDHEDRVYFLDAVSEISLRLDWQLLAYCLMDNHYHLLVQTAGPSLAQGMHDLNGAYAQHFNRRHDRVGHVFQGRYHASLVERDAHFLAVVRYIVRNPVRARICERATQWKWSSHRAMLGLAEAPRALATDVVLMRFSLNPTNARTAYAAFVDRGADESLDSPHPLITGGPGFAATALDRITCETTEVSRAQRARRSLAQYRRDSPNRDEAIRRAYDSGAYSLADIARHFDLHYSTVSRICRKVGVA